MLEPCTYRCLHRSAIVAIALLIFGAAFAQLPYIPPEEYQEHRTLQGDQISFCIWGPNPTAEFDRAVATEVARALLLEPSFYTFAPAADMDETQLWERLLILLTEHCSVLSGFTIVSGAYPDWLIPSRPYYRAPFVFATGHGGYEALGDIPRDAVVGSKLFTEADVQFSRFLGTLPEGERWRRFPYTDYELLFRHLHEEVIEAALVWSPVLHERQSAAGDERLYSANMDPLPTVYKQLGFVVRQDEVYLQALLDSAIENLAEQGVIDRLIEAHDIPGEAVQD